MQDKLLGALLAVGGVLAVVVGLALMLVIVPGMRVFPDDVDTTRTFDMQYLTLLDAETLQFITIPEEAADELMIERNVRVEAVEGNTTLIREEQNIINAGEPLVQQIKHYALDRSELTPVETYPADWDGRDGFWPRQGQVIGWPIGVDQVDYVGWNDDTRATSELIYQEEQERGGINTYYYTATGTGEAIAPEHYAVLGLPESLTTMQLAQLAAGLDVEGLELDMSAQLRLIQAISQALAETQGEDVEAIPLEYVYDYEGEYWIEPATGVLIDTTKFENRAATFPQDLRDRVGEILETSENNQDPEANNYVPPDALDALLPITVNAFYYEMTADSVQDAVDDATSSRDQLNTFGTTVPIILIFLGVVLGGTGGFLFARD